MEVLPLHKSSFWFGLLSIGVLGFLRLGLPNFLDSRDSLQFWAYGSCVSNIVWHSGFRRYVVIHTKEKINKIKNRLAWPATVLN